MQAAAAARAAERDSLYKIGEFVCIEYIRQKDFTDWLAQLCSLNF